MILLKVRRGVKVFDSVRLLEEIAKKIIKRLKVYCDIPGMHAFTAARGVLKELTLVVVSSSKTHCTC